MAGAGKQQEVIGKLKGLVARRHGAVNLATMEQMFRDYADGEGLIGSRELSRLLEDASIGSFLTRPMYVSGILAAIGTAPGRRISWADLSRLVEQRGNLRG
jgi:hypothetical protein